MGIFEKYLSIWVALGIAAGLLQGVTAPAQLATLANWEVDHINLPIAVLIWLMIYPMMLGVDFGSIREVGRRPKGLFVTLTINWLVKPLSMAALALLFLRGAFQDWLPAETANEYISGMILLGVAPCTAMVFVWSQLTKGDPNYTLVQVAVNDLIMIFAFAPISALLLGVTDVVVPWGTLITSVLLFVVLPLFAGWLTRQLLKDPQQIAQLSKRTKPLSIFGLIGTVVLLFAFQAETVLAKPVDILLIAIPLLIQTYLIFAVAYWWMKRWHLPHCIAAPGAMIGASNFFELAVAVAISLFGLHSGAALATVVGVLVEVPVMLSLVAFANRTATSFEPPSD
ncbi:MAG: ACR3 family arsenite efflux transporter [Polyangiaceae bacterium]|nr:ACR3 family arsenite efflux transporter [Polyangiaceae bacterium]